MKKLLALLLAAVMCLSMAACGSSDDNSEQIARLENRIAELEEMLAERDAEIESLLAWSESTEPENTETIESDVISIYTAEELFSIAYDCETTYVLENDIDLTNYSSSVSEFNGTFEGNGKTIRNTSAPLI